jgi:hypothetical protein
MASHGNSVSRLGVLALLGSMVLLLACAVSPIRAQGGRESLKEMLRHRTAALRQQLTSIQRRIDHIRTRTPLIEREVDRLLAEVEAIELPEPQPIEQPDDSDQPTRKVRFRPPILRKADLETPIAIVCKNERVAILDFEACRNAFKALIEDEDDLLACLKEGGKRLPAGDFDIKVTIGLRGGSVFVSREVAERSGQTGEPVRSALRESSRLRQRLSKIEADESAIQFAVYPDSFDEFREVRTMLWKSGFAVNWIPMKHGEEFGIGGGGGGVNIQ